MAMSIRPSFLFPIRYRLPSRNLVIWPILTCVPTTFFAPVFRVRRCSRVVSRAEGRAIVRRSRIKLIALPTRIIISFLSSLKAGVHNRIILTAFLRRFRLRCSWRLFILLRVSNRRVFSSQAMLLSTTIFHLRSWYIRLRQNVSRISISLVR